VEYMFQRKRGKRATKWEVLSRDIQALVLQKHGKTLEEAAELLGVEEDSLRKTLPSTKEHLKTILELAELIRKERLIEFIENSKEFTRAQKATLTKIARAERGDYLFKPPFGWGKRGSDLYEKEEIVIRKKILRGFLYENKSITELARKFNLSAQLVSRILRDRENIGEFTLRGKIYKGRWKPLLTQEEFEQIQSMLKPRNVGLLASGYVWKNGKKVLTPEGEKKYKQIFELRVQEKSIVEIADEVGWNPHVIQRALKDESLKSVVGEKLWEAAQKISLTNKLFIEMKTRGEKMRQIILENLPAYRWELREKTGLSKGGVEYHVSILKKRGIVKEKNGLLQKSWLPFPKVKEETRFKRQSWLREKIKEAISRNLTIGELSQELNVPYRTIHAEATRMLKQGLIEKMPIQRADKIREENERKIINLIRDQELTARQIEESIGLCQSAVSNILRRLAKKGILEKIPPKTKRKGATQLPAKWRLKHEDDVRD